MAKEQKFIREHRSLNAEVAYRIQRKNNSIRRNAKYAAKRMYKDLRPTIVMHRVRGNSLFFKINENLDLLICFAKNWDVFFENNSGNPHAQLACPRRKKRNKLTQEERNMFDKIYIEELANYLNVDALTYDEYYMSKP